jgi:hypothetical protein
MFIPYNSQGFHSCSSQLCVCVCLCMRACMCLLVYIIEYYYYYWGMWCHKRKHISLIIMSHHNKLQTTEFGAILFCKCNRVVLHIMFQCVCLSCLPVTQITSFLHHVTLYHLWPVWFSILFVIISQITQFFKKNYVTCVLICSETFDLKFSHFVKNSVWY